MNAVHEATVALGVATACQALNVSRATYYRSLAPRDAPPPCHAHARALSNPERQEKDETEGWTLRPSSSTSLGTYKKRLTQRGLRPQPNVKSASDLV